MCPAQVLLRFSRPCLSGVCLLGCPSGITAPMGGLGKLSQGARRRERRRHHRAWVPLWPPPPRAQGTGLFPICRPQFPIHETRRLDLFPLICKISSPQGKPYLRLVKTQGAALAGWGLTSPRSSGPEASGARPENPGPGALELPAGGQGGSLGPAWAWPPRQVPRVPCRR